MRITEVKHHLDGRIERFDCRLVLRRPHVVVLLFEHGTPAQHGGFSFPAGSRSFGFFWHRRSYSLYRITGPTGDLIAHRFDVVERMRLLAQEVSYVDLLLDVWVDASGTPRLEDEDEVAEYRRRGLLSDGQRARIERTRRLLLRRHAAIAREAAGLLAQEEARPDP